MNGNQFGTVLLISICLQACLFAGDASGQMREVWNHSYQSQLNEVATCATACDDGGFVLAGYQEDRDGTPIFLEKKLSANGALEWNFAGADTSGVYYDVIQSAEGNLLTVGKNTSNGTDAQLVCSDMDGGIIWMAQYGGEGFDYANCLLEAEDGGIYFAGTYAAGNDHRGRDFWLAKVDRGADGELAWQRFYHVEGNDQREFCYKMIPAGNDGLLLVGSAEGDRMSGFVVKVNLQGELIWSRVYQGESLYSIFYDAAPAEEGGFVLYGNEALEGESKEWLVRINADGEVHWEKHYEDDAQDAPMFNQSIVAVDDGGFFISAYPNLRDRQFSILRRIDREGNELWKMTSDPERYESCNELVALDDGLLLAGYCKNGEVDNVWAIRLGPEDAHWGAPPMLEFREDDTLLVRRDTFDPRIYHHGRADSVFRYDVTGQGGFLQGQNYQGNIRLTTTPNFYGLDSVQVAVLDQNDVGDSVWVLCNITPVNDPPGAPILFHPGRGGLVREDPLSVVWMASRQNPWEEAEQISYTLHFEHGQSHQQFTDLSDTTLMVPVADLVTSLGLSRADSALTISWWVVASDGELSTESTTRRTFTLPKLDVGDDLGPIAPTEFAICGVYPNPFNNRATISFTLPLAAEINLAVFDLSGRKVSELGTGRYSAGSHTVAWNAVDQPAGVYLLKLSDGHSVAKVERMVLLR